MNEQERTLVERYFRNIERTITLSAGSKVIQQDGYNDRLYYVHSGELVGDFEEYEGRHVKVFSASKGAFIGVHSFFSGTCLLYTSPSPRD